MFDGGRSTVGGVLQVHPSRRCNLSCAHCYSSSGPREETELPKRLLLDAIREAAWFGYDQLAVSGGEPLLSPDLQVILRRARSLEMSTSVTTNGLLLGQARRWQRIAPLVDVLAISIDGTEEEHDRLRGREGAYAMTVRNLEAVRATGTPFGFITTLTQYNAASLESVVRLAADEGARSVQVHPLSEVGRAAHELTGERPDGIELAAALLEAQRLGEQYGVAVHVDALTTDQLVLYRGDLVPARFARSLPELAPVLIVEADGRVRPFAHGMPDALALGNLHGAPLHRLVESWERKGRAADLAAACERAWSDLVGPAAGPAVAWTDAVARHATAAAEARRAAAEAEAQPLEAGVPLAA